MLVGIFTPTTAKGRVISSPASVFPVKDAVEAKGWECVELTTSDLENSQVLNEVHVLVLPGGEPRQMRNALTTAARRRLEEWKQLQRPKGLIGICAGSVVACGKGQKGSSLVEGVCVMNDNRFGSTALCSMVEIQAQSALSRQLPEYMNEHLPPTWSMPYVSGPVFALSKSKRSSEKGPSVSIWASYITDVAGESLPHSDSIREDVKTPKNKSWSCTICQRTHSKQKKCCDMKRAGHEKQWKLLEQLVGVMPGKGAIVGISEGTFRSVLFGPHPEMGDKVCVDLLLASIKWTLGGSVYPVEREASRF
jgi:hypothetical protein